MDNKEKHRKKYMFDDVKNIKRLLISFYFCCVVLVILDFVIERHIYHDWESLWAFYPIFGFVSCVVLVVIATWARSFLKRDENYYEQFDHVRFHFSKRDKNAELMNGENQRSIGDPNVDD